MTPLRELLDLARSQETVCIKTIKFRRVASQDLLLIGIIDVAEVLGDLFA
jgi:hypothetical protein